MSNPFAYTAPAPAPAPTTVPPAQFIAPPPQPAAAQQPTTASVPASNDGDPFSGPAPQRPRGPRLKEMYGRLLLITPKFVETVANRKSNIPGATQQRMTCDVVILDGPSPIAYGGRPEAMPATQHTMSSPVPMRVKDMFISSVGLVSQCSDALDKRKRGEPGMVLGRLGVGEAKSDDQNPPYLLSAFTESDKAIARQYLANVDPFA